MKNEQSIEIFKNKIKELRKELMIKDNLIEILLKKHQNKTNVENSKINLIIYLVMILQILLHRE